jgi:hypothetical protein
MKSKQIKALKYLLLNSRDAKSIITRKLLLFLIDKSNELTRDVCITLWETDSGFSAKEIRKIQGEFNSMCSGNRTTHVTEILVAMGSNFCFSDSYGDFDPTRRPDPFDNSVQFSGSTSSPKKHVEAKPFRATFWLSKKRYTRNSKFLKVDRELLEKIEAKSGLYKRLE